MGDNRIVLSPETDLQRTLSHRTSTDADATKLEEPHNNSTDEYLIND